MKDGNKTKNQLITQLRQRIVELETLETQGKQEKEALRESEERYRHIFEQSPFGIGIATPDGKVVTANKAMEAITGYSIEELKKVRLDRTYENPEDRKALLESIRRYGGVVDFPVRLKRKDGTPYEALLSILRINLGGKDFFHTIAQDITERKRAEEALHEAEVRYRTVVDFTYDWEDWENPDGTFRYISPSCERITGYAAKRFMDDPGLLSQLILPEDREIWAGHRRDATERPGLHEVQFRIRRPDGEIRWVEHACQPVTDQQGAFLGYRGSNRDITERKHAEEKLQENESYLKKAQQIAHFGSWVLDVGANRVEFSDEMFNIFGIAKEQFVGTPEYTKNLVMAEDRARVQECYEDLIIRHKPVSMEYSIVRPDGSIRHLWGSGEIESYKAGKPERVIGTVLDITERKQAEETLRETEEKYRRLVENATVGIVVAQDGILKFVNPKTVEITGYSKEELTSRPFAEFIHPDDQETVIDRHLKRLKGEESPHVYCFRIIDRESNIKWVEINVVLINWEGSSLPMIFLNDITERKRAEDALRESEAKYRILVEKSLQGLAIVQGIPPRFVFANSTLADISGYTVEELLSLSPEETRGLIHPDDQAIFFQRYQDRLVGKSAPSRYDFRAVRKDGSVRWLEILANRIVYRGEFAVQAVFVDITDRKRMEEALRISAMEWRASFDAISDTVCLLEPQGRIVRCNKAMTKFLAKPPSKIIGHTCYELLHGKAEPIEGCPFIRMRESRRRETLVLPIGDRWFSVSVDPLLDETDSLIGAVHIIADITERKLMEERIQETNKRLQALIHAIPDLVYFKDVYGHNLIINRAFEKFVGLPQEKIIGKTDEKLLPSELVEHCRKSDEEVMRSGKPIRAEEQTTDSSGQKIVFDTFKVPILDNRGNALGLVGVSRDITERKRAEQELRSSREQLRSLSAHLESVREEERSRIAREIHDELGQTLVALKMELSWLGNRLPKDQKALLERTESMTKLIDMILQKVQRISAALRPGLLDDLGITAAIEWETKEFQNRTGITCDITLDPEDIILDRDRSTAIFRIFQETLTNVVRHARATRIEGSLKERAGKLVLEVRDNGKGITKKQISDPQSFGLIGIRERVHHWGGKVKISGIRDRGTTVTVSIPLHEDRETR